MKASEKIGSSGVYVSDNVEERFETNIDTYIQKTNGEILQSLIIYTTCTHYTTYMHTVTIQGQG